MHSTPSLKKSERQLRPRKDGSLKMVWIAGDRRRSTWMEWEGLAVYRLDGAERRSCTVQIDKQWIRMSTIHFPWRQVWISPCCDILSPSCLAQVFLIIWQDGSDMATLMHIFDNTESMAMLLMVVLHEIKPAWISWHWKKFDEGMI